MGRSVCILFETHATSVDNEEGLASGHADPPLSARGRRQAEDLGRRYRGREPDRVVSSDLRRSWETADIAFATASAAIVRDPRLREVDYGDWTRCPRDRIEAERADHVDRPFPGGESYRQAVDRVRGFLMDLDGPEAILIIGHRATWYALEHWLGGVPLERAVVAPWQWQPGWTYRMAAEDAGTSRGATRSAAGAAPPPPPRPGDAGGWRHRRRGGRGGP